MTTYDRTRAIVVFIFRGNLRFFIQFSLTLLSDPSPESKVDASQALQLASARSKAAREEFQQIQGPGDLLALFSGFVDYMAELVDESLEGQDK